MSGIGTADGVGGRGEASGGGIVLRSRRGPIGTAWHAVALRERLERELSSGRASSGKRSARAGRVQWLDIADGTARADVLDEDGELYAARLDVRRFSDGDRGVLAGAVRTLPMLAARLAAGTYPQEADAVLAEQGVGLLPLDSADLTHDCSCLDWPGPCKHVAALGYVLVEAVEEHPLHLLALRGLDAGDLAIEGASGGAGAGGPGCEPDDADAPEDAAPSGSAAGAGSAPQRAFDPRAADPQILIDALGEDVGRALAEFYRAADCENRTAGL